MTDALTLDGVSRRYDGAATAAVSDVSFGVAEGTFLTLLGPSGSGKTTTLMMIAGFEQPTTGRIMLGAQDVTRLPPAKREIGMVFQTYALFPHLTVRENVAFPLRVRNERGRSVDQRVDEALALVQMTGFADRLPRQLSGGQQQRVAFARAVVFHPRLLLMDEPLSALDRRLRIQMQIELKALQRRLGITIVYVTHDQEEALALSDAIVIMDHGKVAQQGAPQVLYRQPANLFVAGFLGTVNTLRCRTEGAQLLWGCRSIAVACGRADGWQLCLRPEDVVLEPPQPAIPGGRVTQAVYLGEVTQYQVTMDDGETLIVRSGRHGFMPALDDRVAVTFRDADAIVLPRDAAAGRG